MHAVINENRATAALGADDIFALINAAILMNARLVASLPLHQQSGFVHYIDHTGYALFDAALCDCNSHLAERHGRKGQ